MSAKRNSFPVPVSKAATKSKLTTRPSAIASTQTGPRVPNKQPRVPQTSVNDQNTAARSKINRNTSVLSFSDTTISQQATSQDSELPDFDKEYRQIAYGRFLRAMLENCLVEEKIEHESTELDVQMSHLAKRFQQTVEQLDKTNRRMKEISFVAEQKRLLDLKDQDCPKFYEVTANVNTKELIDNLNTTQQASLDQLQTNNVDFGYDKDSGHKQLLDAVNDAITGLEEIKKHSDLDMHKFREYAKTQTNLEDLEKTRKNLENLKINFEKKFPEFNEKLLKEVSEALSKIMEGDEENDDY